MSLRERPWPIGGKRVFRKILSNLNKSRRVTKAGYLSAAIAGAFLLAAVPVRADVYTFNTDNCTGGCLPFAGTISVTPDGTDTVLIDVEGAGFQFVDSSGKPNQFFFNILGNPTISVSFITPGFILTSTTAGALGGSGWTFDYAVSCMTGADPCGPGGSNPKNPPLKFDVTATGLTVASFNDFNGGTPVQFAADVLAHGNTGLVGATMTSSSVPEPISSALVGTGLLGLFFVRRRVRS
jgi:hypothetical protein